MTEQLVPIVDIAVHQGHVDFDLMAARGVRGVIIRLGNGRNPDLNAERNVFGARVAGLAVGGYWFCNPKADSTGTGQMLRAGLYQESLERRHGLFDLPLMMDVESFVNEYPNPRTNQGWTGRPLQTWLEQGVVQVEQMFGFSPIIYSNGAYFSANGLVAGGMARCSLIVARYPFYNPGQPKPPVNAADWDDWIFAVTPKRPVLPTGWAGWSGWQFLAGYDGVGPIYGVESADLDLDLIKPDAWARWLQQTGSGAAPVIPPVEVEPPAPPAVVTNPPAPVAPAEEDTVQEIADSDTLGSALVTFTTTPGNDGSYRMAGVSPDVRAMAVEAGMKVVHWPDATYKTRADAAYRG